VHYRFRDLAFDVPDGLVDQSMVVLVDEDSLALTIAREPRGGGALVSYVDDAVTELMGSVTGFALERREERTVGGHAAIVLQQTATTPEGQPVAQRQAYLEIGPDVVVVTATSPRDRAGRAVAVFDALLASLRVD
jgi:hypothetical protein